MGKQILVVNTFKFPGSGKTLDEAVKDNVHADKYFNTEEKYLKTLISESCREGYHYPGNAAFPSRLNEKEAEVLKKIADAAERPGADLKKLTMEAVIANDYINVKHKAVDTLRDYPYELPDWMKENLEPDYMRADSIEVMKKQLEEKELIITEKDKQINSLKNVRFSPVTITVPQYDEKGNVVKDRQGNTLKTTLNCSQGIDAALGKLAKRCTDQELKIKQLESQLHFYKSNSIQQQKSRSDDSGIEY